MRIDKDRVSRCEGERMYAVRRWDEEKVIKGWLS